MSGEILIQEYIDQIQRGHRSAGVAGNLLTARDQDGADIVDVLFLRGAEQIAVGQLGKPPPERRQLQQRAAITAQRLGDPRVEVHQRFFAAGGNRQKPLIGGEEAVLPLVDEQRLVADILGRLLGGIPGLIPARKLPGEAKQRLQADFLALFAGRLFEFLRVGDLGGGIFFPAVSGIVK